MFYENHHNFFPCSLFFYLNKKVFCLNIEVHLVQQNDSLRMPKKQNDNTKDSSKPNSTDNSAVISTTRSQYAH